MRKLFAALLAIVGAIGAAVGLRANVPKVEAMPAPEMRLVRDTLFIAWAPTVANIPAPNALDSAVFLHSTTPDLDPPGSEKRKHLGPTFPEPIRDTFAYYVGALAPSTVISGRYEGRTYRGTKGSGETSRTWSYTLPGTPVDTTAPPAPSIPPPTIIGPDSIVGTLPDTAAWYGLVVWVQPNELRVASTVAACLGSSPDLAACRAGVRAQLPDSADRVLRWGCGYVGAVDSGQTWTLLYHVGAAGTASSWGNCDDFLTATGLDVLIPPMQSVKTGIETGAYLATVDSPVGWLARKLASR